jgi:predicted nucleotidyltransferase component of viral defense system
VKKQPSNLGASVRQRLLNLAKERGEDFDLVLTRFALERLLYRISVSEHAGKFILKGAMLVAVWLPDAFRATRDLDLLGAGDASPAGAEAVFKDICRTRVEPDGVEFDASSVHAELIREDQQYLGTRVKLEARIAGAVIHLQVDVGYGDAVVPPPTTIDFPQILEFTQPHIRAYSRYTVVAEKLQAAVELGLANSRLKDFFDLYVLSSQLDFDGPGLVASIRATFDRREVAIPHGPPVALTAHFSEDAGKLAQWKGFLRRSRVRVQAPALPAVIESVAQFALEPLEAARLGRDFRKTWRQGGPWT